jgi:hypothetical protein
MTNNAYAKHLIVTGVTGETRPRGSLTLIRYSRPQALGGIWSGLVRSVLGGNHDGGHGAEQPAEALDWLGVPGEVEAGV